MEELTRVATTAQRLKEAMDATGKKQVDLVRDTGLNRGTISRYASGEMEPRQTAARKLAAALDVSEMWLWGYDVPQEREDKKEKPSDTEGLSENHIKLIEFAKSVPEDKAEMILRVMRSIVEDGQ